MTKDDIIKLARDCDLGRVCGPLDTLLDYEWENLQRFANLVAAHKAEVITAEAYRCGYEAGVVAEREECAKLCLDTEPFYGVMFADIIRARGTT